MAAGGEAGGRRLSVQLPPTEAADFEAALVTEFDAIATAVSRVDSRRAVCFTPDDEAMIHDAIERRLTGGHRGLDALLAEALRGWLASRGRAALAQLPEEERGTSKLLNNLGRLLHDQGDLQGAAPLFREALAARRSTLGDTHPDTLTSINNLGSLMHDLGNLEGATPLFREALAARRATLGDAHPDTLAAISNLGSVLYAQGDLQGPAPLFREALATSRATLGDAHPDTLAFINNLGSLLQAQGDLEGAAPLCREALATSRATGDAGRRAPGHADVDLQPWVAAEGAGRSGGRCVAAPRGAGGEARDAGRRAPGHAEFDQRTRFCAA